MRLFYWLKFLQGFIALSLLIRILSTSQLCSVLVSTKTLEQRISDEPCKHLMEEIEFVGMHAYSTKNDNAIRDSEVSLPADKTRLGVFFSDVLKSWDQLWGNGNYSSTVSPPTITSTVSSAQEDDVKSISTHHLASTDSPSEAPAGHTSISSNKEQLQSTGIHVTSTNPLASSMKFETGFKQCINVSFSDYFGFGSNRSIANKVLRLFSAPVLCVFGYLVVLFIHTILQKARPYVECDMLALCVCGCCWMFVLVSMFTIDYNWDKLWLSTGSFVPEIMGAVFHSKVVSTLMFLCILLEAVFNEHLAKKLQLKRVSNCYEVNERSSAGYVEDQDCLISMEDWSSRGEDRTPLDVAVPLYWN